MLHTPPSTRRWLIRAGEWFLLFLILLVAIWTVTQNAQAPQLILFALLYIITINFSLPPAQSSVGLVPLVAVSSFLALGLSTAVALALVSYILAELTAPLWNSFWEQAGSQRPSRLQRVATAAIHIIPLWLAGTIYQQVGGVAPLTNQDTNNLSDFVWLALAYGLSHFILVLLWWLAPKRPFTTFLRDNAFSVALSGIFAQPMAVLGNITFVLVGLPIFVVYCLGVMIFSLVIWLSWQRRNVLEQQYSQLALLNDASTALRETLDLTAVLHNTHHLVTQLIPTDSFTIALLEGDTWQRPFHIPASAPTHQAYQPDDFTHWVATQARTLYIEARDLHFASRHQLTPPQPTPFAWLGTPLTAANQVVGVIVVQRFEAQPFSRWHQEMLLAIAGQASAAIQNARLHSETVRLYNLTDEALAQRVKQLQALLDSIQEGVLMLDTTGRIALINPFAAKLIGQQPSQLMQHRLETAVAPTLGYQTETLAQLITQLRSSLLPEPGRTSFQHHNKIIIRLEAPVLAANQQLIGWLMLFRDVTEEHQLAEQRTDLTRMIIHDLRNPISTLISTLDLAQTQLNSTDTAVLADARQGCLDMLDMVDSLMDITRLEAGQMVVEADALYLHPLIQKLTARLQPLAAQRHIELTFTFAPDLPAVWADEEMMRRVLLNLLDNALKFTPANGRIHGHLQPEPAHSPHQEPGLRCALTDTGPGIPPEHREQVFNRFMRTNAGGAQVRGTGLGLAFCKMAVEAHNGRIWVESAVGGGSQFIFTLPGVPRLMAEGTIG
ncbi:MAG: GAF domain-containing protein [Ardenticatenaceae bacterium]|nr:GAF domain-containing protein [Ardenticatenaceae bacterium]